jgi:hypothetical protein
LGEQIRATVERAKESDPKQLRRRIAELEKQLAAQPAATIEVEKLVEVPVLKDGQLDRVDGFMRRLEEAGGKLIDEAVELRRLITPTSVPRPPAPKHYASPQPTPAPARPPSAARPATGDAGGDLPRGERLVLTAIAQYSDGADREQLSVLTGYKRSSRDTYLQRLRERGLIDVAGDRVRATESGVAALGDGFDPLPTGAELQAYWMMRLPEGERRVLEVAIAAFPEAVDRGAIGASTGYKRSSRDTYLQRLRSRRLIEIVGRAQVRASETLF